MDIGSYGQHAVDLVNTWDPSRDDPEWLPDVAALQTWVNERLGLARAVTESDLTALREARDRLRAVFEAADDATAVTRLNVLLREHPISPVISGHDGRDWHLHLADDDRPVGELLIAAMAFGLSVLLLDVGFERRGVCGSDTCWDVYVDTTRNHSRRYCSSGCSNRSNVRAFRARQRHSAD